MPKKKIDFAEALHKCEDEVKDMGLVVIYTNNMDPFFKGDLDGKRIFIGAHLSPEEKLFNLIHLAGHSVQWNLNEFLRDLGSELYRNPSDKLLKKLQNYEWQASCYGLSIMRKAGFSYLGKWLTDKYVLDMFYLTHFYKTGTKLKRITTIAKTYPFKKVLKVIAIPEFIPIGSGKTRNGLVIFFDEEIEKVS